MNPAANVSSIQALEHFRADLAIFTDQAQDALVTLDMEVRRVLDWLDTQSKEWKGEIRDAENDFFQAKNELARRKMMRIGDRPVDTTEQEKILARAKARLEYAEDKLEATKRWLRQLPDDIKEYEGNSRNLQSSLEIDLPKMLAWLESKIVALEAYQR